MDSGAATLPGVVDRLKDARLRLMVQGMLAAVLWSAAAGLAAFAALDLLRRLFPATDLPPLAPAAALAAVVLAAGIAAAILRAPTIPALARRADHLFGLRERISTALELEQAAHRPPVIAALLADTLKHTGAVSAQKLAAFRLPRAALLVPLAAICVWAITLVPPQPVAPADRIERQLSATLSDAERAVAVEDITQIADAIAEEAATQNDSYMAAIATTLKDVGERLAASPETTRGDMLDQLETLLDYATSAGSGWQGSGGERIPQLLETLERSVALPNDQPAAAPGAAPVADTTLNTATGAPPSETPSYSTASIDLLLDQLQQRDDANEMGAANRLEAREEVLDYIKAAQAPAAVQAQPKARQSFENTQQMFGAQADAGAAEEQLAGEGTEAISDNPITERVDLAATASMVLTGEDTGEGRYVDVEIAPDAQLTTITDQTLAANTNAWQRRTETETGRYSIGIDNRDNVSRYLRALLGPGAQ